MPDDITKHLRGDEYERGMTDGKPNNEIWPTYRCLEALAVERELSERRRALMEKHEFSIIIGAGAYCPECFAGTLNSESNKHAPDCLWAKAIGPTDLKEKGE